MDSERIGVASMDTNSVIITMLIVCGVLTVLIVLAEPLKKVIKVIINSAIGAAAIFCINLISGIVGLKVGINIATALAAGILGLPGIAALYIMQIILG